MKNRFLSRFPNLTAGMARKIAGTKATAAPAQTADDDAGSGRSFAHLARSGADLAAWQKQRAVADAAPSWDRAMAKAGARTTADAADSRSTNGWDAAMAKVGAHALPNAAGGERGDTGWDRAMRRARRG